MPGGKLGNQYLGQSGMCSSFGKPSGSLQRKVIGEQSLSCLKRGSFCVQYTNRGCFLLGRISATFYWRHLKKLILQVKLFGSSSCIFIHSGWLWVSKPFGSKLRITRICRRFHAKDAPPVPQTPSGFSRRRMLCLKRSVLSFCAGSNPVSRCDVCFPVHCQTSSPVLDGQALPSETRQDRVLSFSDTNWKEKNIYIIKKKLGCC